MTGQKTKRQSPMIPVYSATSETEKLIGHFARPEAKFWERQGRRVKCTLCYRQCVLDKEEKGWCQIRKNENGELVLLDPYTLSTAAIWRPQTGYYREDAPVAYFGGINCTFGCAFCSSTRIAWSPERLEWIGHNGQPNTCHTSGDAMYYRGLMHPEGAVNYALDKGVDHIHLGANEPLLMWEWSYETARLAHEAGFIVTMDTNGVANPEAIRKIAPFITMAFVGIKGTLSPDFYKRYIRAEGAVPHVIEGIRTWYAMQEEAGTHLILSDTIAPYHWMDDATFERQTYQVYSWIAEEFGDMTPLEIRGMIEPQFPPAYDSPDNRYLAPKDSGEEGQSYVTERVFRATRTAKYCGLKYAENWMSNFSCHNCGLLLRGDAAPDHFCKSCGVWTPIRTWSGQDSE